MPLALFHPLIQEWFRGRFPAPTEPQELGWPRIFSGDHTLIAAPTGSGKTLTAFLVAIDRLLKRGLAGELRDEISVVYVSPLRALSNDMHRNLTVPLHEIAGIAYARGTPIPPLRAGLRTGDSSPYERQALLKRPPHLLVTTPESLYLMLTSPRSRTALQTVDTVIVDEIHALIRDKRGSHLALTLERLSANCQRIPQRIGLSATQKPIERTAEFLVGLGPEPPRDDPGGARRTERTKPSAPGARPRARSLPRRTPAVQPRLFADDAAEPPAVDAPRKTLLPRPPGAPRCHVVDVGHRRALDLAIEVPPSELGAVCTHEQWAEVNARLVELIKEHRSTLVFVNTRRLAERVAFQLTDLMGEDAVSSHHGSLSADSRLSTEQRLKSGQLKAVVATSSLELGLDVGYIDLVIQLGSPQSIAGFLQRVGRSGHALGLVPKGRLFALTRDELMECMALIRAVRAGHLDTVHPPAAPLDVLAQQIVAEVAMREWSTNELYELVRRAAPYRDLPRKAFDEIVEMLAEGIAAGTGRSRHYLYLDRVQKKVRTRPGAGLAAISNGGAIPEIASYRVVAEPDRTVVGTLDEDFSVESQAGDVFLLGTTSWKILHVRGGEVTVVDAQGAPPSVPFWVGEAPGRTYELSLEVSRLREELSARLDDPTAAAEWLVRETSASPFAAEQIVRYGAAQKAAIGLLPTASQVVFERFFDESGGMQLLVHAPFGARVTKAWGLALRKRFCRSFDFELQATADDDGLMLSLGPQHSFPLESMFPMVTRENARSILEQAILAAPMFRTRWRWNVVRALLVMRQQNGKKVPPPLQRFRSDDLLTAVFPAVTGCKEEVIGDIPLPDHPLVRQTMEDCLREALDLDGLHRVMEQIAAGEITLIARDTREPSPFAYELLNANPYAFLDGGEIQERRARAVATRRTLDAESVADLGTLDPLAIEQVRLDAQPVVRDADELHDVLLSRILLPETEGARWEGWFRELLAARRACRVTRADGYIGWCAAERRPAAQAAFPAAAFDPPLDVPEGVRTDWSDVDARVAMVRGLMETCGPIAECDLAERLSITPSQAGACLEYLEGEGVVLRGKFTVPPWTSAPSPSGQGAGDHAAAPGIASAAPGAQETPRVEWCHRRLLARIHRLTLEGLRKQIQPVSVETFLRFLTRHQGLLPERRRTGSNGLFQAIAQLQGIDVAAAAWERDLLPGRMAPYQPNWLDELCLHGEVGWGRLFPPKRDPDKSRPLSAITRIVPISLFVRADAGWLQAFASPPDEASLSSPARDLLAILRQEGASFAVDLLQRLPLLPRQLDDALGELAAQGFVTADGFGGLRRLIRETGSADDGLFSRRRPGFERRRSPHATAGRWTVWRRDLQPALPGRGAGPEAAAPLPHPVEQWAWQLLRRWGVMFKDLLAREDGAPNWFQLLQVYRRLEARGEIRGGRFIAGVAGEQFALGEAVAQLRTLRDTPPQQELVVVSGADPLNLVGIVTRHPRVPATASNRVAFLDGVPVAARDGGTLLAWSRVPAGLEGELARQLANSRPSAPRAASLRSGL